MRRIVFIAGYALTACSGGGTPLNDRDGTRGDGAVTPSNAQAVARMNGGAAAGCAGVPAFSAGQFSDATPSAATLLKDGTTLDGSIVNVNCRVVPTSGGFDVSTYVFAEAGLSIDGSVDANGKSAAAKLTFKTNTGAWQSESCTLEASGPFMGVAAGRYWAQFACTGAKSSSAGESCDLFGEIRFENCATE